jgi:Glycosyl hydrolases family 18
VTARYRLAVAIAGAGAAALVATSLTPASASASVLPSRMYAPYFETWTKANIATVASHSKAKYFTLAFIQSAGKTGAAACRVTWNGDQPISSGRYLQQIATLRSHGGNVIPSFGGYSADQGGTEIADSCKSVKRIARAYEQVITTYHVTRLDMDVEAKSLTNRAGIARRSAAMAMVQHWASARGINLQIQLTLGVEPGGLGGPGLRVVKSAVAHGVQLTSVNMMVFDYYLGNEKRQLPMAKLALEAAWHVHHELGNIFPALDSAQVWHMQGMTILPGIDDYPKKTEVTSIGDTKTLMSFALGHDMNVLTIWAIQRDNGKCPGAIDSNSCSGIRQSRWAFSHLLESFTG